MTVYAKISLLDIATIFVQVSHLRGRLHSPGRQLDMVTLPGRAGAVVTDVKSTGAKEMEISGTVFNPSLLLVDRKAAEDSLKDLLYGHPVTIEISDGFNPAQVIDGYATAVSPDPRGLTLVAYSSDFGIRFVAPNPFWRDVNPRLVGLSGTAKELLIGTAPSTGVLRLMGAATPVVDPVFRLKNQAGEIVRSTTFTITLSDDDYIEHDFSTGITRKSIDTGPPLTIDAALVTAGTRRYAIEPRFGYRQFGVYPLADLTATSGTPTGVMQYTPQWL